MRNNYNLYDICDYVTSRTANIENYISTENMLPNKGGVCAPSNVPSGTAIEYKSGDILISNIRPYFQKIWQADCDGACSADVLCIRANNKADSKYLYYLLSQQLFFDYVMSGAKGCKMPRGDKKQIMQWQISLPPLEEQRRIAGILGAIDDKIENNRRINTNLELQAQALYKQWFVDFNFPNEDGKPYKSSGGKMVDSELGPIPDGWSVIGYCDAVDIKGGGTPPTNNPEFWNGSIPFFTPKDVPSDCFAIHTEKSITEAGLSNCNSKLYAKDTVFITARGTVGKVVMAGCSMAMNQTNYALIGKNELSQYFVYLLTIALVDRLLKKANGAVFNAITTRDFEGEQIVHPTNFVLGKFIDIISPLYQQVLSIAKENETLAALRDTLLPKLMMER